MNPDHQTEFIFPGSYVVIALMIVFGLGLLPNPTTMDGRAAPLTASDRMAVTIVSGADSTGDSGFETVFTSIPVSDADDAFDPLVFHKSHFSDSQYRVILKNDPFGIDETQLWKTPDFSTWTKVANSIAGDADQFADHIVLPDGTFVLYQSTGRDGPTAVWTGKDLTNLTKQGEPIPEPDGGVFYDETTGTVHIFTEDEDYTTGPGSDKLSHWTTPDDDLLNATKQRDAFDVTGKSWHTGDPDIVKISGTYYMFADNTTNHPNYRIAVLRSTDLYDWTILQENINPQRSGGDMVVTRHDSSFVGFTEYDNYAQDGDFGVGQWKVAFHGDSLDREVNIAATGGGIDGLDRSFDPVPGGANQPAGVLRLQPDSVGATLSEVTVQTESSGSSGVEEIGLFGSNDSSFDASDDTRLASRSISGTLPSEITFSSLADSVRTDRYIFLTVSLSSSASGQISPFIQHQGDLVFSDGRIDAINGSNQTTFQNLQLSSGSSALPVELAGFNAKIVNAADGQEGVSVRLRWFTSSEANNAGFAVQFRQANGGATDGNDSDWHTLGFVESKEGESVSSGMTSYSFRHEELPFERDRLVYRLRQVDTDGSERFTKTVSVKRTVAELRLLKTYPNPVRGRVTVRYTVPERVNRATLRLYDILGRAVRTVSAATKAGRHEQNLSVQDLASGVYFLRLRAGGEVQTRKLTVVE